MQKCQKYDEMRQQWRQHIQSMAEGQDISGIELVNWVRITGNFFDSAINQHPDLRDISGPRMGILMHLMIEEDTGNLQGGVNPTRLSHFLNVKKNTVSSLLNGLEEQGLIERNLDPQDKRVFYIRITQAGRERITTAMPLRIQHINQLTSGISTAEKQQLISLLDKLNRSMILSLHNLHPSPSEDSV
mgnify:CR=1 FL=1